MERTEAELILNSKFRIEKFFDTQWIVINKLLKGERVLLIERTGFGKSLCFQFPAVLFDGITIVFSPLIALMRDQVNKLNSLGIAARCINSNQDDAHNSSIIREALHGEVKILYIAPERMENAEWLGSTKDLNISMIVIDEAHCISTWGHDFRPSYQRIVRLVNLLPQTFPVLAATATATPTVEKDIVAQIGNNVYSHRGGLIRKNFRTFVGKVASEDDKMIWLAENLPKLPGSGIIYTGTRADTEFYSRWLQFVGIDAVHYNADLEPERRKEIEKGLIDNRWKCVVSTNALGMGMDKPDLRFVIHTQTPISPVHYYQEIGRAGRDGKNTFIILFYNPDEDDTLPWVFIESAKPSIKKYEKVIRALRDATLGERDIARATDLKNGETRTIKADLLEQGIINEVIVNGRIKFELVANAKKFDDSQFELIRKRKRREYHRMKEYIDLESCRMQYLCKFLGDNTASECGKCDNDTQHHITIPDSPEWKKSLKSFYEDLMPILDVSRKRTNLVDGAAGAYYRFPNVGDTINACKYKNGGDFPERLVEMAVVAYRNNLSHYKFDVILYVPPVESGPLVENLAQKISVRINVPISHDLQRKGDCKPQRAFQNNTLKRENVKDAFSYKNAKEIRGKKILLIDDVMDTGITLKEIGDYLTKLNASIVAPLVIAKALPGDIK